MSSLVFWGGAFLIKDQVVELFKRPLTLAQVEAVCLRAAQDTVVSYAEYFAVVQLREDEGSATEEEHVELEVYIDNATVSLEPGQQSVTYATSDFLLANSAMRFLSNLNSYEERTDVVVTVVFEGGADGLGGGTYIPERFRPKDKEPIRVPKPRLDGALLADQTYSSGDRITNGDLALIRAHGAFKIFQGALYRNGNGTWIDSVEFVGTTYKEIGAQYRYSKISFRIIPRSGEDT